MTELEQAGFMAIPDQPGEYNYIVPVVEDEAHVTFWEDGTYDLIYFCDAMTAPYAASFDNAHDCVQAVGKLALTSCKLFEQVVGGN